MAGRRSKVNLDYFPMDCQNNDSIKLIELKFGLKGFAIVTKLLQKIYGECGYYCEWNDKAKHLLTLECTAADGDFIELIDDVVTACLEDGIFSREMYEKYGILTSEQIQKNYFKSVSRRDLDAPKEEFLLIDVYRNTAEVNLNSISVDKNTVKVDLNSIYVDRNSTEVDLNSISAYRNDTLSAISAEKDAFIVNEGSEGEQEKEEVERREKSDIKEIIENKKSFVIKNNNNNNPLEEDNNNYINNSPTKDSPLLEHKSITKDCNSSNTSTITRYFPDDKLNQAFLDYKEMRVRIRKPMTQRAIQMAISKLEKLATPPGQDHMDNDLAIEILDQSTFNSWQGIFPLRDESPRGEYHNRTADMLHDSYRMMDDWLRESKEASGNDS